MEQQTYSTLRTSRCQLLEKSACLHFEMNCAGRCSAPEKVTTSWKPGTCHHQSVFHPDGNFPYSKTSASVSRSTNETAKLRTCWPTNAYLRISTAFQWERPTPSADLCTLASIRNSEHIHPSDHHCIQMTAQSSSSPQRHLQIKSKVCCNLRWRCCSWML